MNFERANEQLTVDQAFDALRFFLQAWWERGERQSEDARWLLSATDRSMTNDGGPGDPAMWFDFLDAVDRAKAEKP